MTLGTHWIACQRCHDDEQCSRRLVGAESDGRGGTFSARVARIPRVARIALLSGGREAQEARAGDHRSTESWTAALARSSGHNLLSLVRHRLTSNRCDPAMSPGVTQQAEGPDG